MAPVNAFPTDSNSADVTLPNIGPSDHVGSGGAFFPQNPKTLEETGLHQAELESLVMRFLLYVGGASGRNTAE